MNKINLNPPFEINGIRINGFDAADPGKKQNEKDNRIEQNDQKEIIRRLRIQTKKLMEQSAILRKKLNDANTDKKKIAEQLSQSTKINKMLSDALGSCDKCWGEDPKCRNCSGKGISGWRRMNKRMFNVYVLSCLQRLNSTSKKRWF